MCANLCRKDLIPSPLPRAAARFQLLTLSESNRVPPRATHLWLPADLEMDLGTLSDLALVLRAKANWEVN